MLLFSLATLRKSTKHLFLFFPGSLMTVVQAGFSPGGNCDGENTAQVQTLVRLGNTLGLFRIFKDETMDNKLMYIIKDGKEIQSQESIVCRE